METCAETTTRRVISESLLLLTAGLLVSGLIPVYTPCVHDYEEIIPDVIRNRSRP